MGDVGLLATPVANPHSCCPITAKKKSHGRHLGPVVGLAASHPIQLTGMRASDLSQDIAGQDPLGISTVAGDDGPGGFMAAFVEKVAVAAISTTGRSNADLTGGLGMASQNGSDFDPFHFGLNSFRG